MEYLQLDHLGLTINNMWLDPNNQSSTIEG